MTVPPRQPDSFSQNQNRKELSPAGLPLPFSGSSFDENMLIWFAIDATIAGVTRKLF